MGGVEYIPHVGTMRGLGPEQPPVPDSQSPEPAGGACASGWIGESGVRAASAARVEVASGTEAVSIWRSVKTRRLETLKTFDEAHGRK